MKELLSSLRCGQKILDNFLIKLPAKNSVAFSINAHPTRPPQINYINYINYSKYQQLQLRSTKV